MQVLLLDEVTVDLDVVARMDLLDFFKEECEQVWTCSLLQVTTYTGRKFYTNVIVIC